MHDRFHLLAAIEIIKSLHMEIVSIHLLQLVMRLYQQQQQK